jgi:glycerol-3-phosphate dehydrogenase
VAKDAVDMATNDITKLTNESITAKLAIIGADGYFALAQQAEALAVKYNLKIETINHLLSRYGSDLSDILELIENDQKTCHSINARPPVLKG